MSENVVLPRSGVTLVDGSLVCVGLGMTCWSTDETDPRAEWVANWRDDCKWGTRDECIAWLDRRVLDLRAALLQGARERVAKALFDSNVHGECLWEDSTLAQGAYLAAADAVLAALAGGAK